MDNKIKRFIIKVIPIGIFNVVLFVFSIIGVIDFPVLLATGFLLSFICVVIYRINRDFI